MHPNQVMRDAEAALEEFRRVNTIDGQHQREPMVIGDEGWMPPPKNTFKINWDASLDKTRRIVGMGIIARDGSGSVIAASTKVLFLEVDPVVAESLAATHALILCHALGFQQVIFEGDAQQVVNAINSESLQYKLQTSNRRYSSKTLFFV
jgi:hypothetical protein